MNYQYLMLCVENCVLFPRLLLYLHLFARPLLLLVPIFGILGYIYSIYYDSIVASSVLIMLPVLFLSAAAAAAAAVCVHDDGT